jgi:hypothetical protein
MAHAQVAMPDASAMATHNAECKMQNAETTMCRRVMLISV